MKLILAVVEDDDAMVLMDSLVENNFSATKLASTGGFLLRGNTTLLIGVEDRQVDEVLAIIRKTCHRREQLLTPIPPVVEPVDSYVAYPVKVEVGGAPVPESGPEV